MSDINKLPARSQYTYEDIDYLIDTTDLPEVPTNEDIQLMLSQVEDKLMNFNIPSLGNLNLPVATVPGFSINEQGSNKPNIDTTEGLSNYFSQTEVQEKPIDETLVPYSHSIYESNFERYYHHPKFKEIGFNPFIDNEEIYNKNSTIFDDAGRSIKMFGKLWSTGLVSSYRAIGDIFDEDSYLSDPDLDSAREFANATRIGNSTRGGVGGFINNLGLQLGYTAGIITSVFLEEAALSLMTGGASLLASPMKAAARVGTALKTSARSTTIGRGLEGTYSILRGLNNIDKYKDFRDVVKAGGNFVGKLVAPESLRVMKTLSTAKNAGKNISNLTKISKTIGAGYRDLRSINYAMAEAKMESGLIYDKQFSKQLEKLQTDLNRRDLTKEELDAVKANASEAAFYGLASNALLIYATNQFTLGNALSSYSRRLAKALDTPGKSIFDKINVKKKLVDKDKISTDIFEESADGFLKRSISDKFRGGLKRSAYGALRYSSANIAEGIQEIGQEAIAVGAETYYDAVFEDPSLGGINLYLSTIGKGLSEQMSMEGLEVFLSGFFMAGPANLVQNLLFDKVPTGFQYVFNNEKFKQEKARKEEAEKVAKDLFNSVWNEMANDESGTLFRNIENFIVQKQISEDLENAVAANDLLAIHDLKDFSKLQNILTIIRNGGGSQFRSLIEDALQMSKKELAEAFPSSKDDVRNNKIEERLNSYLKDFEKIEKEVEEVDNLIINNFDETQFELNSIEYYNELNKKVALERYKTLLVFSKDKIRRSTERLNSIYSEIESLELFTNMDASDVTVLLNPNTLANEIVQLERELELFNEEATDSTSEKELYKKKKVKLDGLKKINDFYNEKYTTEVDLLNSVLKKKEYLDKYETIGDFLESEDWAKELEKNAALLEIYKNRKKSKGFKTEFDFRSKRKLAKLFTDYMSNLAELEDGTIDPLALQDTIVKIFDYSTLQLENYMYNNAAIALSNPNMISETVDRLYKTIGDINKKKQEYFVNSFSKLQNEKELVAFLKEVAELEDLNKKNLGVFISPENLKKFRETKERKYLIFENAMGVITPNTNPQLYRTLQTMVDNFMELITPKQKQVADETIEEGEVEMDVNMFDELTEEEVSNFNYGEFEYPNSLLEQVYNMGLVEAVSLDEFKSTELGKNLIRIVTDLFGINNTLKDMSSYSTYSIKIKKPKTFGTKNYGSVKDFNNFLNFLKQTTTESYVKLFKYVSNELDEIGLEYNNLIIDQGFDDGSQDTSEELTKDDDLVINHKGYNIIEKKLSDDTSEYIIEDNAFKNKTYKTLSGAKKSINTFLKESPHRGNFKMWNKFQMFYGKVIELNLNGAKNKYVVLSGKDVPVKKRKKLFVIPQEDFSKSDDYKKLRRNSNVIKLTLSEYEKAKPRSTKSSNTSIKNNNGKITIKNTEGPKLPIFQYLRIYPLRRIRKYYSDIVSVLTQEDIDSLDVVITKDPNAGELTGKNFTFDKKTNNNLQGKKSEFTIALNLTPALITKVNTALGEEVFSAEDNTLGFLAGDQFNFLSADKKSYINILDLSISDYDNFLVNIQDSNKKSSLQKFKTNYLLMKELNEYIRDNNITNVKVKDLNVKIRFNLGYTGENKYGGTLRPIDTEKYNYNGHQVVIFNVGGDLNVIESEGANFDIETLSPEFKNKIAKAQGYVLLYTLPNGEPAFIEIKSRLATDKEKDKLYKDIAKRILKTRKDNTIPDPKNPGLLRSINDDYNTLENKKLNDRVFIAGDKNTSYELQITNNGSFVMKLALKNKDGKYENQKTGYLETVFSDLTDEELFDKNKLADNIKTYIETAGGAIKELTGKSVNIRMNIPIDATIEEVLDVAQTNIKENVFPNKALFIDFKDSAQKKKVLEKLQARQNVNQSVEIKNKKNTVDESSPKLLKETLVSGVDSFGFTPEARQEVKDALGENPTAIDMIEAGFRTRTVRSNKKASNYNVGDVIEFIGDSSDGTTKQLSAVITDIYEQDDPLFDETYEQEGWVEGGSEQQKTAFKSGARAIIFKLVSETTTRPGASPKVEVSVTPTEGNKKSNLGKGKTIEEIQKEYLDEVDPAVNSKKLRGSQIFYATFPKKNKESKYVSVYGLPIETNDSINLFLFKNNEGEFSLSEKSSGLQVVEFSARSIKEAKEKATEEIERLKNIMYRDSGMTMWEAIPELAKQYSRIAQLYIELGSVKPTVKTNNPVKARVIKKKEEPKASDKINTKEDLIKKFNYYLNINISNSDLDSLRKLKLQIDTLNLDIQISRKLAKLIRENKDVRKLHNDLQVKLDKIRNQIEEIEFYGDGTLPFKIIDKEDSGGDIISMKLFRDYIKTNFPDVFSVQELDTLQDNLDINGVRIGAFLTMFNTVSSRVEGVIYTSEVNKAKFHEAFHGIFRLMLNDQQIDRLLEIAVREQRSKLGQSYEDKLSKFKNSAAQYRRLSRKQLIERFAEEYIADLFDDYTMGQFKAKEDNIFVKFFKWLLNKIFKLNNSYLNSDFKNLFEKINSGYYKSLSTVDNRFTRAATEGVTTLANSIIRSGSVNDGNYERFEYLDPITASNIVDIIVGSTVEKIKNISSYVKKDKNGESTFVTIGDLLDDSIQEAKELYDIDSDLYSDIEDGTDEIRILNQITNAFMFYNHDFFEAAREKIELMDLNYESIEDKIEEIEESGLVRNSDAYDLDAELIGGYRALPLEIRKYFSTILISYNDMFGNSNITEYIKGVAVGQKEILVPIDVAEAYNGFIKAVANTQGQLNILKKLILFANNNANTNAVVNKLLADLNVTKDQVFQEDFDINSIENKELFVMITKGFENFRVEYRLLHGVKNKSTGLFKTFFYSTSNRDDARAQVDRWGTKHRSLYPKLKSNKKFKDTALNILSQLQKVIISNENVLEVDEQGYNKHYVKLYNDTYSFIVHKNNVSSYRSNKRFGALTEAPIDDLFEEMSKTLYDIVGLSLSPLYIKYSYLRNALYTNPDVVTDENQFFLESNLDIQEISGEDIIFIKKIVNSYGTKDSSFLFKTDAEGQEVDESAEGRLTKLALANAEFDETVGAGSFINAEGKMVYNHQLGTFILKKIKDLNAKKEFRVNDQGTVEEVIVESADDIIQGLIEKDPILVHNYLLHNPAFIKLMEQGKIKNIRINGDKFSFAEDEIEKITDFANTGDGTTYGSLSAQMFLVDLINAYTGGMNYGNNTLETVEVEEDGETKRVGLAPVLLRVLESSNTGEMPILPVVKSVMKDSDGKDVLTQEAEQIFLKRIFGEFQRIQRESKPELGNSTYDPTTGEGDLIVGYNAREVSTDKSYTLVYDPNGRAFKFFNAGKVLEVSEEFQQKTIYELTQTDATVKDIKKLKESESGVVFFKGGSKQTRGLSLYNVPYKVNIKSDKEKGINKTIELVDRITNDDVLQDAELYNNFMEDVIKSGYIKLSTSKRVTAEDKYEIEFNGKTYVTSSSLLNNFLNSGKTVKLDKFKILSDKEIAEAEELKNKIYKDEGGNSIDIKTQLENLAKSADYIESYSDFIDLLNNTDLKESLLLNIINRNVKSQFISMYNVLKQYNLMDKISSDILNTLTDNNGYELASESSILNLRNGDREFNLFQVFVNDYINTAAINDIMLGDQALGLKDAVDLIKRARGENAAIISFYNEIINPNRDINFPVYEFDHLTFSESLRPSKIDNSKIENADGEMYVTLRTYKYTQNSLGRLSDSQLDAIRKLQTGEKILDEDVYGFKSNGRLNKGLEKKNEALNPKKWVYYDGETYLKMSAVVLTQELTSEQDVDGNWIPKIGLEDLHNLRLQMEAVEVDENGEETGRLAVATPTSASKMQKKNVVSLADLISRTPGVKTNDKNWSKLSAKYFGLQVENNSGKDTINDPVQIKNLIMAEIPQEEGDNIFIEIDGNNYSLNEIKEKFYSNENHLVIQNYVAQRNLLFEFTPELSFNLLEESKKEQKLKPQLRLFIEYALKSLQSTNSNANLLPFFEEFNGNAKYDLNNSIVEKKFISLILTYFSNKTFRQKLDGDQLTLISDFGYNIIRQVYSVDSKGFPDKQVVIRRDQFKSMKDNNIVLRIDEGPYKNTDKAITSKLKKLLDENNGKPVYILDRLRHDLTEYKIVGDINNIENWEPTGGRVTEMVTTPQDINVAKRYYTIKSPAEILRDFELYLSQDTYSPSELAYIKRNDKIRDSKGKLKRHAYKFFAISFAKRNNYKFLGFKNGKPVFENPASKDLSIPNVLAKAFSTRIPSQEKHSAVNTKTVEFLPPIYGSSAILPSELVQITGWDFDVDKIFSQFKSYYINENGQFEEYKKFEKKDKEGNVEIDYYAEYEQYMRWANSNVFSDNNSINSAYKIFMANDIEIPEEIKFLDKLVPWRLSTKDASALIKEGFYEQTIDALSVLGMPRTLNEYIEFRDKKKNTPNTSAIKNENLDLKYASLSSPLFREDRVIYKDKDGNISNKKKKGYKKVANAPAIYHQSANLDPLFSLMEDLKHLEEWWAEREEKDVDVDNFLGKFMSFYANKLGAKNIGAIVLPNVYLSVMGQVGLSLNKYSGVELELNGKLYNKFGQDYEIKSLTDDSIPQRINYIISALITAMTDNAKERIAPKLGLNKNALSVVGTMLSLGVPLKTSVLLVNNRVIQHLYYLKETNPFFNIEQQLSIYIDDIGELIKEKEKLSKVPDFMSGRILDDLKLERSIAEIVIDPFQDLTGDLAENLNAKYNTANEYNEVKDLLRNEAAIYQQFIKASTIQKYTRNVGTLVSMQGGIGNTIEGLLNLEEAEKELFLDKSDLEFDKLLFPQGEKNSPVIVDVRPIFKSNVLNKTFHTSLYKIYKDFSNNILSNVVLQKTKPFDKIMSIVYKNVRKKLSASSKAELMQDLSTYLTMQSYMRFLLTTKDTNLNQIAGTLTNDLKYKGDTFSIVDYIEEIKSFPEFESNFFLNNFVTTERSNEINNKTGLNLLVANTFQRLNDVQKLSLSSSLNELTSNRDLIATTSAIVHYAMVKDGLRTKYKGITSAIGPTSIEPYLKSVGGLMRVMKENDNAFFERYFGMSIEELAHDFINGYLSAVSPSYRLNQQVSVDNKVVIGSPSAKFIQTTTKIPEKVLKDPKNIYIAFNPPATLSSVSFNPNNTANKKYMGIARNSGIKVKGSLKDKKFIAFFSKNKKRTAKMNSIMKNYEKNAKVLFVDNLASLKEWITKNSIKDLGIYVEPFTRSQYLTNLLIPILSTKKEYTTTTDKIEIGSPSFLGYKTGFDFKGKGTTLGDGKDKAMRKLADTSIVELYPGREKSSSMTTGMSKPWKKSKASGYVMLARNAQLTGEPLRPETIEKINIANEKGATFIVGDMPGVDSAFIDYLIDINAPFYIYTTAKTTREARIQIQKFESVSGEEIKKERKKVQKLTQAFFLDTYFGLNKKDTSIEQNYDAFEQYMRDQIVKIKDQLYEEGRIPDRNTPLSESGLKIFFNGFSLSQNQKNFMRRTENGLSYMSALSSLLIEEFGYDLVNDYNYGLSSQPKGEGVYIDNSKESGKVLVFNPFRINAKNIDNVRFTHIPPPSASKNELYMASVKSADNSGFERAELDLNRPNIDKNKIEWEFPTYKEVIITKFEKDDYGRSYRKQEKLLFKLKETKTDDNGNVIPAVKSYGLKHNVISEKNPIITGYYAEYEEVPRMGSTAETPISFVFQGDIKTYEDIKYEQSEEYFQLMNSGQDYGDFDYGEDYGDFDYEDYENQGGESTVGVGNSFTNKIKKGAVKDMAKEFWNENAILIMAAEDLRYHLDSEVDLNNEEDFTKAVVAFSKNNTDIDINDVFENIKECILK